jgi:hypothetical protein
VRQRKSFPLTQNDDAMKSLIRSFLFIGAMVLFLKVCLLVATHSPEAAEPAKHRPVSASSHSFADAAGDKPST